MSRIKDHHYLIATVLGSGELPMAPGTWGSLAGLFVVYILRGNVVLNLIAFILFFSLGIVSSREIEKREGIKDPSFVVIDEFACMFIVFLFLPLTPVYLVTGFILFRVMDIFKVPPMKMLEKIGGGWGIMLDDLMAAVYTNFILQIVHHLIKS